MQAFAEHQPITAMVDAIRALALGPAASAVLHHGTGWYVTRALPWALVLVAVFAPLAVARFRRG